MASYPILPEAHRDLSGSFQVVPLLWVCFLCWKTMEFVHMLSSHRGHRGLEDPSPRAESRLGGTVGGR